MVLARKNNTCPAASCPAKILWKRHDIQKKCCMITCGAKILVQGEINYELCDLQARSD